MTQRVRFIERLRLTLHKNVDSIIDSLYQPDYDSVKGMISSLKIDLEKIQNQIKSDD
jgi:hypothetical protein